MTQNGRDGVIPRVGGPRKTLEVQRPTVEVEGHPLSDGFPLHKISLEVLTGSDASVSETFEKPIIRIGADPLCDLVMTDRTVSSRHAEIRRRGDSFELIDLDSTNGTFMDGEKIETVEIETGKIFQVGRSQIMFTVTTEQISVPVTARTRYGNIIGQSKALREIFSILDRVAPSELSVVIEGETGTGKELIAAALHENSTRESKPFVVFDCSAFPATLLESEIFGHERGAFSGATQRHRGVFERADGGTIFFDELGEMDIEFQSKFLRVLESGEVRRVGGESVFKVDVRVVAATNRNLEDLIEEKKFRQDLFYRLAKVRFILPPLHERPEDIPLLAEHFLNQLAGEETARPLMTEDALRTLQTYRWPGNIRQLRNVIEKAVAMCSGGAITAEYLRGEFNMSASGSVLLPSRNTPDISHGSGPTLGVSASLSPSMITTTDTKRLMVNVDTAITDDVGDAIPFKDAKDVLIEQFEKVYLERLLSRNRQNISKTAREAQIDRRHLYRLLKKHELMDES